MTISKHKRIFDFVSTTVFVCCACQDDFDSITRVCDQREIKLGTFMNAGVDDLTHQFDLEDCGGLDGIEEALQLIKGDVTITYRPGHLYFADDDTHLEGDEDTCVQVSVKDDGSYHVSGPHLCAP